MARPNGTDAMRREMSELRAWFAEQRGKLDLLVDMATREHQEARENRRLVFAKLDAVDDRVASVEHKVEPLPGKIEKHGTAIDELQTFRSHVGAVVAVAGAAVSLIVAGIGWLLMQFWEPLAAWVRRLMG